MTINSFTIEYDAINSKNTFTNGDIINGRIIVELSKEIEVQSLMFIASGRAEVSWTEHHGHHGAHGHHGRNRHYWAKEAYYEVKQHILRQSAGSNVLKMGRNVFPFTFQIPDRKMPSTFKHNIGKIVHKVKAELKRSMRLTEKAKKHFTFVSKPDTDIHGLMEPQYGCKDKSVLFGSGSITMDVHTKKMGYMQGEDIEIIAEIKNNSSRSVKPKFVLLEKKSFFAQGHRKIQTKDILKDKLDEIPSSGKETLKKKIPVPSDLPVSITNCNIIKLEYRLKVFLDIKYAADPEVKLPIVVMPALTSKDMTMKQHDLENHPSFQPSQPIGYPIPPGGYPMPPGGYPVPPGGYPVPTGGYPAPSGGYPAPSGGYPAPSGGYPAPSGGYPAPPGGYPAPPGGAPPGGYPNQPYVYPTAPFPNQSQPPKTNPGGPPPAYSASNLYPNITSPEKREDKL
ncbi:arrestin domain-containing protein 3-like isoform 2-T2 [Synchiropus picturatus]